MAVRFLLFLIHILKIVHVFPQVIEVKNAAFSTLECYLDTYYWGYIANFYTTHMWLKKLVKLCWIKRAIVKFINLTFREIRPRRKWLMRALYICTWKFTKYFVNNKITPYSIVFILFQPASFNEISHLTS